MMKYINLIFCALILSISAKAQKSPQNKALNSRSDTINILHYTINLDLTDYAGQTIKGNCGIRFTPKINNVDFINLDLLDLQVDSVVFQGDTLNYTYQDSSLLHVNLANAINIGDTIQINVFYHGHPVNDPYWGGFYFKNNYIYNIGVSFTSHTHSYGRTWFPCFDNFVSKATYTFNILTADSMNAHCNGYLAEDSVVNGDTLFSKWIMPDKIPAYLACVDAAKFATVHQTHVDLFSDTIPIELVSLPSDTTNVKNTFVHLGNIINLYESWYGPYRWNKVGYSMLPITKGAMEHATNIAFPVLCANGTTAYESTYAHELSHHWWGDLVTCEDAQQMWINEGMAHFSEYLLAENEHGHSAYVNMAKSDNFEYLQNTALIDSGHWALSDVPLAYTYGDHSYIKGALTVYNLRSYLGDSLLKVGFKYITSHYAFQNISSTEYRDAMETATGKNLHPFFDDWVLNPGYTAVTIDSVVSQQQGAQYDVTVYVRQSKWFSNHYFTGVPMTLTFRNNDLDTTTRQISVSNQYSSFNFTLPFNPVLTTLNEDHKINDAVTSQKAIIKTSQQYAWSRVKATINVNNVSDSTFLRVEHYWVAPTGAVDDSNVTKLSHTHYWNFQGIEKGIFQANILLNYDGRAIGTSGGTYLDTDLTNSTVPDSIILMYRKNAAYPWKEYPYYSKIQSNTYIDYGLIIIDSLQMGQYCFARGKSEYLGIKNNRIKKQQFFVYPNPAKDNLFISTNKTGNFTATIYDLEGKLLLTKVFNGNLKINTSKFGSGIYFVKIASSQGKLIETKKFIVSH